MRTQSAGGFDFLKLPPRGDIDSVIGARLRKFCLARVEYIDPDRDAERVHVRRRENAAPVLRYQLREPVTQPSTPQTAVPRTVVTPGAGWLLVLAMRLFPSIVESRMAEMNGTA